MSKRSKLGNYYWKEYLYEGYSGVMGVSLRWLLGFIVSEYEKLPDDLNFHAPEQTDELIICTLESEVDEMFSFVGNKQNKQWIFLAYDSMSKQIIAFHVGDRSRKSAKELVYYTREI